MAIKNRSPSDFEELSAFLSDVATVASIGASGFALLDAYLYGKDLRYPAAAFLFTIF